MQDGGADLKKERIILTLVIILALLIIPSSGTSQRGRPDRDDGAPKVGDMAPTFKLKTLDGQKEVDIGKLIGKKPIILIFGSYT